MKTKDKDMEYQEVELGESLSNCCGASPSYLSDELCGACLEHSEFSECEE